MIVLLSAGLCGIFALQVHWSDSELWSLGLARDFWNFSNPSIDYKLLFNLILGFAYIPSIGNVETIHLARCLFAAIGALTAGGVFLLSSLVSKRKSAALWTTFLFVSSSLFLSQSMKLRSDSLATLFQVFALCHFMWAHQQTKIPPKHWVIGSLLNLYMLLCTPKAVFQLAINFIFIVFHYRKDRSSWTRQYLLVAFAFPAIAFALLVIWKWREFSSALIFFISSFKNSQSHPEFFSQEGLEPVFMALQNNSPLIILGVGAILSIIRNRTSIKFIGPSALAAVLIILFHNDRLPFFIYSLSALPIIFVGLESFALLEIFQRKCKFIFQIFITLILVNSGYFIFKMLRDGSNDSQIQAIKDIETYLRIHPGTQYFDANAILPRDTQVYAFPAPDHEGNKNEILEIVKKPDINIILFSNRMFYYMTEIYSAIEDKPMIAVGSGVFAKAHVFRTSHQLTIEEWQKICVDLKNPKNIYVYYGENFLSMKMESQSLVRCQETPQGLLSDKPFMAFTIYEPLNLPEGKSFAEIFDHNPEY